MSSATLTIEESFEHISCAGCLRKLECYELDHQGLCPLCYQGMVEISKDHFSRNPLTNTNRAPREIFE